MAYPQMSLEELIAQLPTNLGGAIMTPEQQAARVAETQAAMGPELGRQYGAQSQRIAESQFGRGFGLSSQNAYQQALNSLMEAEAFGKMQLEARNATDAAQRAAVGNAMNYATSERNRAQAASESAANRAQAQQMQKRAIRAAQGSQARGQLYGAAGQAAGGIGGILARDLMRPEGESSAIGRAYGRLEGLLPGGGKEGEAQQLAGPGSGYEPPQVADFSPAPYTPSSYNLSPSAFDAAEGGFQSSEFSLPPIDFSGMGLGELLNSTYEFPGNFWDQEY